ncbi:MAG: hypothetical protein WBW16_13765, partial [Bacteroidota bacterium]
MAQPTDYKWEIHWDAHTFSEDDVNELASALHRETGTTISLRPRARYAALVDVFIVLAVYYVGKSVGKFFEKVAEKAGERVGDEIGDDIAAIYCKLKSLLIEKLKKNKSEKGFQCLYEINLNGILIRAVLRANSDQADLIANSIDSLKQLMEVASSVVDEFGLEEDIV